MEYVDLSSFSPSSSLILGSGSFASVYLWNGIAVKSLNVTGEDYDYLKEISALVALSGSDNIVRFMGSLVTSDSILIATEAAASDMHAKFTPNQIKHEEFGIYAQPRYHTH